MSCSFATETSESDLPHVAIVVLNWNNYEDTSDCLDNIQDIDYENYSIYVVDNGSSDGSGERLAREHPHCKFIFNDENQGFAAGNNIGINQALSDEVDHVLLLNNDTKPEPDFLHPLVNTASAHDKVAAISGVIYDTEGNIQFAGGSFSPVIFKLDTNTQVPKEETFKTNFVTGAFMFLTDDFLQEGYRLDEDYFFGREDIDLSITASREGWDLLINPNSQIVHKRASTGGNLTEFRFYHRVRNYLHFSSSTLYLHQRIAFYLAFCFVGPMLLLYLLMKERTDLAKAVLIGIYDYFRNAEFRKMGDFE